MGDNKDKLGSITVGYGTKDCREVEVKNYMQFEFADSRAISISELVNDEGYVLCVENLKSTGRADQSIMWLSEISFKALVASSQFYLASRNGEITPESIDDMIGGKKFLGYRFGGNIAPIFEQMKKEEEK